MILLSKTNRSALLYGNPRPGRFDPHLATSTACGGGSAGQGRGSRACEQNRGPRRPLTDPLRQPLEDQVRCRIVVHCYAKRPLAATGVAVDRPLANRRTWRTGSGLASRGAGPAPVLPVRTLRSFAHPAPQRVPVCFSDPGADAKGYRFDSGGLKSVARPATRRSRRLQSRQANRFEQTRHIASSPQSPERSTPIALVRFGNDRLVGFPQDRSKLRQTSHIAVDLRDSFCAVIDALSCEVGERSGQCPDSPTDDHPGQNDQRDPQRGPRSKTGSGRTSFVKRCEEKQLLIECEPTTTKDRVRVLINRRVLSSCGSHRSNLPNTGLRHH